MPIWKKGQRSSLPVMASTGINGLMEEMSSSKCKENVQLSVQIKDMSVRHKKVWPCLFHCKAYKEMTTEM